MLARSSARKSRHPDLNLICEGRCRAANRARITRRLITSRCGHYGPEASLRLSWRVLIFDVAAEAKTFQRIRNACLEDYQTRSRLDPCVRALEIAKRSREIMPRGPLPWIERFSAATWCWASPAHAVHSQIAGRVMTLRSRRSRSSSRPPVPSMPRRKIVSRPATRSGLDSPGTLGSYTRSNAIAMPWPTPMHIVASA